MKTVLLFLLTVWLSFVNRASAQLQPGTQLWSFSTPWQVTSSPALAIDGTIFLGTTGGLYAITNAGSNKWTFAAYLQGSPAVGTDGTVYFGDYGGTFYALNPNGSVRWSFPTQAQIASSPAIGPDGTIYFVATGRLIALNSCGAQQWEYQVDETSTPGPLSPVIGADGTIYVGSAYGEAIFAVHPDGSKKWQSALVQVAGDSPAIAADGTLYITGGRLYAFNGDGTNLWSSTSLSDFIETSPPVGRDGTIYVADRTRQRLWSFTPDGQTNWSGVAGQTPHPPPPPTPAIDSSGTIYHCASNAVFALSPAGDVEWVFAVPFGTPVPPTISSPTIGPDGTIYVAFQNTLYALYGTNKLADSSWPMYRQNARHTGRIEKPSVTKPQKRADANFQFQIYDTLGNTNTVQASTDLFTWTSLTDIVITNVPMDFIDFTASNFTSRFYRTLSP